VVSMLEASGEDVGLITSGGQGRMITGSVCVATSTTDGIVCVFLEAFFIEVVDRGSFCCHSISMSFHARELDGSSGRFFLFASSRRCRLEVGCGEEDESSEIFFLRTTLVGAVLVKAE